MTGEVERGKVYQFNCDSSEDMGVAVVQAVAKLEGRDPCDGPLLFEAVNPDALDMLFKGKDGGTVSFEFNGYEVAIQFDENRLIIHRT